MPFFLKFLVKLCRIKTEEGREKGLTCGKREDEEKKQVEDKGIVNFFLFFK